MNPRIPDGHNINISHEIVIIQYPLLLLQLVVRESAPEMIIGGVMGTPGLLQIDGSL